LIETFTDFVLEIARAILRGVVPGLRWSVEFATWIADRSSSGSVLRYCAVARTDVVKWPPNSAISDLA
jgi:hypothetical protein